MELTGEADLSHRIDQARSASRKGIRRVDTCVVLSSPVV